MKNKILLYTILLSAVTGLTGCNDMLDKSPLDSFEDNPTYWNNPSNVEASCNTFYEEFLGYGNAGGSGLYYFKTLSDDQVSGSFADWTYTNVPASDANYRDMWTEVKRANTVITRVTQSSMDDTNKKHYIGIGRLMRAYEYYNFVRMYGDVQWVDKILDVTDKDILYGTPTDRDVIMDYVLEDLNYACNNIKEDKSKITFTRQMANAMKSEICLWEGTFRKYRSTADSQKAPDLTGAEKFLNASVEASNYIMSKGYSLNSSYQGNYNSIDLNSNPEMIFFKAYKNTVLMNSLIDYTCTSTTISGISKDAFDNYLFTDGKPAATTSLNNSDAGTLDANGNINIKSLLAVRDKRLSETIDTVLMYKGNAWARLGKDGFGMDMTSASGYGVRKYDNLDLEWSYRGFTGANFTCAPVYWLSVIYLNYAEAKAELNTLTAADLNMSINLLNKRAGLPDLSLTPATDPANNMNVSNIIWEIRRARRCELIMDNWNRYWDLIRWHQLDKLDSKKYPNILLGANVVNDPNANVPKSGNYIDGANGKARIFDKKYYLYPIPSGQITLNPNLKPNPGWN